MIERFDIFAIENDGEPAWVGTAGDMQSARLRASQMASKKSVQRFLVLDQKTDKKIYISAAEIMSAGPHVPDSSANSVPRRHANVQAIAKRGAAVPIKVLLADDSQIIRNPIVRLLREEKAIEIVGEASDFAETLQKSASMRPDVVVLDLHMPDHFKFSAEAISAGLHSSARYVLAISAWNDEETKTLAQTYGANATLDKFKLNEELIPAILQAVTLGDS